MNWKNTKIKISKVSELLILPYMQHWKIGNLWNLSFTSNLTGITKKIIIIKTTTNEHKIFRYVLRRKNKNFQDFLSF